MPFAHTTISAFEVYLLVVAMFTAILCINGIVNLLVFQKPKAVIASDDDLPFISVLVPARNEEQVIEACVRSLLSQNYPNFEVVVLDDNSSDATYDILCHLRDQDYRLRTLVGAALPEGWCGKPFACWQLAQAAKGEYILMTDADCEFAQDALLFAIGGLRGLRADVVSLAPDYVALTFWERLIIPILVLIPMTFLPLFLVRGSRFPVFAAANGAFLFMRRETYFEIDGHRAVKSQLAEDVKFGQLVKRCGKTIWYGDGNRVYKVRMYENLSEIWQGFTRNLFPAFSSKLQILVPTLIMLLCVFVLPPFLGIAGWMTGAPWALLAAMPYLMFVALRISIALTLERDDILYALLNPLAWSVAIVVAIGSVVKTRKSGASWKGRVYVGGQERK